jgi:hypothetical protein
MRCSVWLKSAMSFCAESHIVVNRHLLCLHCQRCCADNVSISKLIMLNYLIKKFFFSRFKFYKILTLWIGPTAVHFLLCFRMERITKCLSGLLLYLCFHLSDCSGFPPLLCVLMLSSWSSDGGFNCILVISILGDWVWVTGLSVLWVAYATHSTLKPVPTLPR